MVIMIQLADVWPEIIPANQKGFVPGRQMVDHLLQARAEWERLPDRTMVAVCFQRAWTPSPSPCTWGCP
jgi:hypothetical protein